MIVGASSASCASPSSTRTASCCERRKATCCRSATKPVRSGNQPLFIPTKFRLLCITSQCSQKAYQHIWTLCTKSVPRSQTRDSTAFCRHQLLLEYFDHRRLLGAAKSEQKLLIRSSQLPTSSIHR